MQILRQNMLRIFAVGVVVIMCLSISSAQPQNEEDEDPEPKLCSTSVSGNSGSKLHHSQIKPEILAPTKLQNVDASIVKIDNKVATVGSAHGGHGHHGGNHHGHNHASAQSSTHSVSNAISSTNAGHGHHHGNDAHGQAGNHASGGHHHVVVQSNGPASTEDGEDHESDTLENGHLTQFHEHMKQEGVTEKNDESLPGGRRGKTIDLLGLLNIGNSLSGYNPHRRSNYHNYSCPGKWVWHEGYWAHGAWHQGQWIWTRNHCQHQYQWHGIDIDRQGQVIKKAEPKKKEKKQGKKKFTGGYHRRGHFG